MATTSIEWTDETWNPIRGCSIVSKGCTNCYAMKQAHRFSGRGGPYEGLTTLTNGGPVWTGKVRLVPELLDAPLRWRRARRVFVNSMSDLFHEDVPDEFIGDVFWTMEHAPQHQFQVLTKRPERMRKVVADLYSDAPLGNVWLGVSVEDQATADERIPLLLETPAAVRFVSAEPLLGPVDVLRWLGDFHSSVHGGFDHGLDWVIVGGESGPGARPCDVHWIRGIVQQCQAAQVPVFCKQLGARRIENGCSDPGHTPSLNRVRDRKGADLSEWPADLRVREMP